MSKVLVIGDVHATPGEIQDCEALWRLVGETYNKYDCDSVLLLGDIHHTHDILSTPVIDFWTKAFNDYKGIPIVALCGNHDQFSPTIRHPHSLISYQELCIVVDKPVKLPHLKACAMPYYVDPVAFINDAAVLKELNPDI